MTLDIRTLSRAFQIKPPIDEDRFHSTDTCELENCPICNPVDIEELNLDMYEMMNHESYTSKALTAIGMKHEIF